MTQLTNLKLKSKLYFYAAQVTEVYDGDTITVDLDLGLGIWRRDQKIRLWKIDTPEIRGSQREEGLRVRDFVRSLILDKPILLRTILDKRGQDRTGKYGRLLGEVLLESQDGQVVNLNELLLEHGMALPMTGGGAIARTLVERLPARITCPFCGETRQVDVESAMVEVCPNCLAEAAHYSQL